MTDRDRVYAIAPEIVTVEFELSPVRVILDAIKTLADEEQLPGVSPWLVETSAHMTHEERRKIKMIGWAFWDAIKPKRAWADFENYMNYLEQRQVNQWLPEAVQWLIDEDTEKYPNLTADMLFSDLELYKSVTRNFFAYHMKAEKGDEYDEDFFVTIYQWMQTPQQSWQLAINTLRDAWRTHVRAEYERNLPLLRETINAFQQQDYEGLQALEAIRAVTGRDMTGLFDNLPRHLVFVPVWYLGPYLGRYDSAEAQTAWILFNVRAPSGSKNAPSSLGRQELNMRLNALADDTRLRMLELIAQHDEICAQDIITALDITQSAASRHLRQLTVTGFLTERRRDTAKCYTLNTTRLKETISGLKTFLRQK
jgi:DNA-binding transcriptional ArsR family regulator